MRQINITRETQQDFTQVRGGNQETIRAFDDMLRPHRLTVEFGTFNRRLLARVSDLTEGDLVEQAFRDGESQWRRRSEQALTDATGISRERLREVLESDNRFFRTFQGQSGLWTLTEWEETLAEDNPPAGANRSPPSRATNPDDVIPDN